MKRLEFLCPSCGDDCLYMMLRRAPGKITPGWMFPCPNCLEFARVTPERTLRKATRQERVMMLTDPEARALVDSFNEQAKQFRQVRNEYMRTKRR